MLHADLFRSGHWFRAKDTFRLLSIVVENVTETTITVRWTMSEGCQAQLEYGTSTSYGSTTTEETSFDYFEHVQTITGLDAGTSYHLRSKSTSAESVVVYSADQPVTTSGGVVVSTKGPRVAPAVPTGSTVYTISAGIASDGTGDVGAAITSWLNGLPAGSTAVFTSTDTEGDQWGVDAPVATFRLATSGIDINVDDLTLWGYGCKLLIETPGTSYSHAGIYWDFTGQGQKQVTVRGFQFEGQNNNAATTTAHDVGRQYGSGISSAGDMNVTVYDCWMHNTWSDGIYVVGWGDTDHAPWGYDLAYNLIEDTGRYGITLNQNDSGTAWIHHNIIRDTALNLMGGEDQRLGTEEAVNILVEDNDLGTFMWHDTSGWLPHGIGWNYDWWDPLPNIGDCGPITIQNNTWTGGCAEAMFNRHTIHTNYISQETKSGQAYHDITVTGNDWTGVPTAQRTVAKWAAVHYTTNVTLTDNTNLGTMATQYETTGSTGVTVSGNT